MLACGHKGRGGVLIADFFDVEEAAADTDVRFPDIFHAIHDSCPNSPRNTIVIRFTNATYRSNVRLDKVVLCQVCY
jgi:hypothetical protein